MSWGRREEQGGSPLSFFKRQFWQFQAFFFRWVKKQQNRVSKVLWQITNQLYTSLVPFCAFAIRPCFKVLLIGLYKDQESPLKMLRTPNNVVNDVMSIVWDYLTWRWQVGLKNIVFPWFSFQIHSFFDRAYWIVSRCMMRRQLLRMSRNIDSKKKIVWYCKSPQDAVSAKQWDDVMGVLGAWWLGLTCYI